ncbi:MAG: efflux RND transporter periplasmic adaptor subunit [Gammaproteobacteria bacterium]
MRTLTAIMLLLAAPALWAAGGPSVQVRTATVAKHRLADTITAFGTVRPDPEAQTTMDASYTAFVQRVYVTLGQPVHKGDPLLQLRTAPSARAAYLSAQANVRYARLELQRKRRLLHEKLATHSDVDAARKALETAKAAFAAQQELGTGKLTRIIKAPFTGIVSQLPVKPGNEVQVGTQLFQLARRDRLEVALGVEPDEESRVHGGQQVLVQPLFGNGGGVRTSVSQVNAVVDPNTRLVDVIVRLTGKQAQSFLPGMRVQGTLTLKARDTLAVPRSAVLHDSKGNYLFVVRAGKAHRVNVRTGLESGGLIGVRGTLQAGEQVVVQGNYELSDGMAVRLAP